MTDLTNFEELLIRKYGHKGSPDRDMYEKEALAFRIGVMLRAERKKARLTQDELAQKTGTKKSYISRIERGKSDIQIATFQRIIEAGLGKNLIIDIV